MKFSSTSSTNVQRCLCPLFQNKRTRVLLPPLFRKISKPSGQGQQNSKPHTVDCHPSPSELTSMIHPLICLWILKRLISLEYFLNFFSNLYIPSCLQKSFKFMVLRLLEDTYVSRNLTMNLINLFLINYTWMVFTFENSFLYFVFYIISFIFYVRILLYF